MAINKFLSTALIFFLIFLSISDRLSLSFGAIVIKAYFFYTVIAAFILVYLSKFKIKYPVNSFFSKLVILFFLSAAISVTYSIDRTHSVLFLINMFSNIILTIYVSYNLFLSRNSMLIFFFDCISILAIVAVLSEIFFGLHRARFFSYETSYLSLLIVTLFPAIMSSNLLGVSRIRRIIWIFSLIIFSIFSFSTLLFLGIISFSFAYLIASKKISIYLIFLAIIYPVLNLFKLPILFKIDFNKLFASFNALNFNEALQLFLSVSGNRANRIQLAYENVRANFPDATGVGNYLKINNVSIPELYSLPMDRNPYDLPAVNIYLEALATIGLGGIFLIMIFLYSFFKIEMKTLSGIFFLIFTVQLFLLNFESSFIRPYVWLFLGIALALEKKQTSIKTFT